MLMFVEYHFFEKMVLYKRKHDYMHCRIYICTYFQYIKSVVSHLFLVQLCSFNYWWESRQLTSHWESIWYCLALLSWLNIVHHSVLIQFAWFNLQMKSLSEEIFINIWHCLFIDQKDQKDYIKASFRSTEFI